jgi:hypothetical protein
MTNIMQQLVTDTEALRVLQPRNADSFGIVCRVGTPEADKSTDGDDHHSEDCSNHHHDQMGRYSVGM